MIFRLIVFTIGFALGAAAQAVAQLSTPAPEPQPAVSATAAPTETPTPASTATSSPSAAPSPSPTENPYKYVVDPTPDPSASPGAPQIIRIEVIDKTIHVGGQFACRITTSVNVANLVISVEGYNVSIPKAQDGLFAGIQTLPSFIPPWMLKTYQVTFSALTSDGKKVATTIPITLAY
jgi:pyruvate/2-oxoglutarate dehydrogenase complex dihydrolipoamide acyltransferase (E2) component